MEVESFSIAAIKSNAQSTGFVPLHQKATITIKQAGLIEPTAVPLQYISQVLAYCRNILSACQKFIIETSTHFSLIS